MKIKDFKINHEKYGHGDLTLSHLDDNGKCHILTSNYGEVTSTSLNKTEIKQVIKWLQKWIALKEQEKKE